MSGESFAMAAQVLLHKWHARGLDSEILSAVRTEAFDSSTPKPCVLRDSSADSGDDLQPAAADGEYTSRLCWAARLCGLLACVDTG
jgi:hypothetical protein